MGRLRKGALKALPLATSFLLCLPELPSAGGRGQQRPAKEDMALSAWPWPAGRTSSEVTQLAARPRYQEENITKVVADTTPALDLPLLVVFLKPVSLPWSPLSLHLVATAGASPGSCRQPVPAHRVSSRPLACCRPASATHCVAPDHPQPLSAKNSRTKNKALFLTSAFNNWISRHCH